MSLKLKPDIQHRVNTWIVLILCGIAFGRGVYGLGGQSLWWDESLSHYRATRPVACILTNRIDFPAGEIVVSSVDNHPPLYFVLLRGLILVGGDSEFTLRFLSVAAGLLIIPLLYRYGAYLFGSGSGILAACLGACSPFYLWYQQEARPYMLATLMTLLSCYALLRLLGDPGRSARWGWVYVVSVVAMLTTHYYTFLILPAQAGMWLIGRAQRQRRLRWFLGLAGGIAVALFVWSWSTTPPPGDGGGYRTLSLVELWRDVLQAFTLGLSGDALAGILLAVVVLVIMSSVLLIAQRQVPRVYAWFVVMGFAVPVMAMFLFSLVRPAYLGSRHVMFASPFYYVLLAAGVSMACGIDLNRRFKLIWPCGSLLAIILAGMLISNWNYRLDPRYVNEDHRSWGRYLSEHVRPDDIVFVVPAPVFDLYTYYTQSDARWIGLPQLGQSASQISNMVARLAGQYDRIWVAFSSTPGWANIDQVVMCWLEEHAHRVSLVSFDSSTVTLQAHTFYTRLPVIDALPHSAHPLDLVFQDQLALVGLRLLDEATPAGRPLKLSLYWRTLGSLPADYRLALALKDDEGLIWASADTWPLQGAYPTSQWPVGQLVRDDIDLDVPPGVPPGRYTLTLSVYPADHSGPALTVRDGQTGTLQGLIVPVAQVEIVSAGPLQAGEMLVMQSAPRQYGDIALVGHQTVQGTYRPGQVLLVHLYWQARRRPQNEPSWSLRLTRQNGEVIVSRSIPASPRLPAAQWQQGELIWSQYRFRVPIQAQDGEYRLELTAGQGAGMWPFNRPLTLGGLHVEADSEQANLNMPTMQHSLVVNLGDQIELLGYDLEADTVRPGEVVSCTLYWRAIREIDQNYTVFNHLMGQDGQAWGMWDNQPQRGALPTTRWRPGQVVADPYQIPVAADAPAGPLQWHVGMYNALNMARLPVRDEQGQVSGDHIVVIDIQVKP